MPHTVIAETPPSSVSYTRHFSPVPAEELAYALTVFVSASSRTFVPSQPDISRPYEDDREERQDFFADLLPHFPDVDRRKTLPGYASLTSAFTALWNEYRDHDLRDSLCARVLCFHFLMERTAGRAVEKWIQPIPERPEEIILHPAVVDALASVFLDTDTGLTEANLSAAIHNTLHARCVA